MLKGDSDVGSVPRIFTQRSLCLASSYGSLPLDSSPSGTGFGPNLSFLTHIRVSVLHNTESQLILLVVLVTADLPEKEGSGRERGREKGKKER